MSAFYNVDQPPFNMGSVARAIAAANNGALFDPSDMSTMFQDAAGTIPVTAVEQLVGKILDKSGNGNHATQSVTASRPTLSARKNILLATETLATQSVTSIAAQYTLSFSGTGSVTLSGAATGTLTGTGAYRVSLTFTPTAGTLTLTVSGSVTKAQLELGTSAGTYQRVNTSTDYDTDPRYFPKYLRFDGVDDYMNLPYMGLYANGSASVVAATTVKPSTWSTILAEGAHGKVGFYILARYTATNKLGTFIQDDNMRLVKNLETPITPGITTVLSVVDAGSAITHWVSSMLAGSSNYTRSGTLTSAVTLVGIRPFADKLNGNLYGLIITKSALTDAQRIKCERFLARKAGVML